MEIEHILAELRAERAQIEAAILALEKLSIASHKRRGRPPKWLAEIKAAGAARKAPDRKPPGRR